MSIIFATVEQFRKITLRLRQDGVKGRRKSMHGMHHMR